MKYLFYVLLMFSMVLLSALPVSAQAVGYCTYPNGTRVSGYSQAQCSSANGSWFPYATSNQNSTSNTNQNNTSTNQNNSNNSANQSSTFGCDLGIDPNFQNLVDYVVCIVNGSVIPLIFSLAVVMFVWGVVQYVINSDEEAKKAKGKQFMIWGIIALTVMVGVWGLVNILGNTFGLETGVLPQVKPN